MDMSLSVIGSALLGKIEIALAAQDVADLDNDRAVFHPAVEGRGLPSSVDALAAMNVPAAVRVAAEQAKGKEWQVKYDEALAKLRGKAPGKDAPLWSADLYHAWLALLGTLATPMKAPAEAARAPLGAT
jgi:hypothetical protein